MVRNEFIDIINGRKVAIVGNGDLDRDYSAEIDAADVVVRFNHFYNYGTGRAGRKVDVIFQIFTSEWDKAPNKHADVIRSQGARIFCVRKPEQYSPSRVAHFLGSDVCVSDMSDFFRDHNDWTCGGTVLTTLAALPLNAEIRCYGFPQGAVAEKYFSGPANHYKDWRNELAAQQRAIETLERCTIRTPRQDAAPVIVIPVKAVSAGAKDKNAVLLPRLLEKLAGQPNRVVLVGKADELAHAMVEKYGVEYFKTGAPTGEVTDDIRSWRDLTEYCGEVVLLQCTSPYFRIEWIEQLVEARKYAPVAAICEEIGFKVNGIYSEAEGVYMQLVRNFGAPSVPRQKVARSVHLTGGGFAFHSDALSKPSFFNAGVLRPVVIDSSDALDVDTEADLAKVTEGAA